MPTRIALSLLLLSALAAPLTGAAATPPAAAGTAPPAATSGIPAAKIVAIVNGDVVSGEDVNNRRRLFALSTGLPFSQDVLDRLTPQITRQLIDERLRLQEVQRRRIVVSDQDIASSIEEIETHNGMQPGTLRKRLEADGVGYRTLVDQIRVQIGWTRVLRQQLGNQVQVSDADIAEREQVLKSQFGQLEFRVGDIFIPIDNPAAAEEASKFAETVIQQLRAGAPFPVVAAQFNQSQTALTGGDLGWVQPSQLDPQVLRVLEEMPEGAISNPIHVPGGIEIVTLHGKREIGHDIANVMLVRQAFVPFTTRLDPRNPTDQQRQALAQGQHISASVRDCDALEAANKSLGEKRPSNPGEIRLENVSPAMRAVLEKLPDGKATQPLVSEDGIMVLMICSREQKNLGVPTREEMSQRILNERIDLASRQLMRDLQRRAVLDQRS